MMDELRAVLEDPARIAAVRRLAILDTGPTEPFDRLVRLTARTLHCPVALVTLVDADRQYLKAAFGLPPELAGVREVPLEWSICQFAVGLKASLVVSDTRIEHWLDDNLAVRELGVRAYAGIPLTTREGLGVGALCAIDLAPHTWTSEDLDNLGDLAGIAMREVGLHRLELQAGRRRDPRRP